MDEADARAAVLALPEVTERQSWGQPAWFHRKLVARMWDDERLTVRRALQAVPVRQRAVLVLRYYLGMTADEAGEVLGIRAASVRSQTTRGLVNLRAALAAGGMVLDEGGVVLDELGEWTNANAGPGGAGDVRAAAAAVRR